MLSAQTARRAIWRPLWELPGRYELVSSLARRDLLSRYKGSALGIVWAILTQVVMIAIFTFIFAKIFGARFSPNSTAWDYALYLFCGLLPWTMFQETVQRAATTIVSHANLVKRVLFPLETLPAALTLSSLANQLFGIAALLVATLILRKTLPLTIFWLPILLIPQTLLTMGAAWLVSSLGVFLRDLAQGISLFLLAAMYLTPIIYPESVVPEQYRGLLNLNPFTPLIRSYRMIMLEGANPDWAGLAYFSIVSLVIFYAGYWWFARTRKNFADVI